VSGTLGVGRERNRTTSPNVQQHGDKSPQETPKLQVVVLHRLGSHLGGGTPRSGGNSGGVRLRQGWRHRAQQLPTARLTATESAASMASAAWSWPSCEQAAWKGLGRRRSGHQSTGTHWSQHRELKHVRDGTMHPTKHGSSWLLLHQTASHKMYAPAGSRRVPESTEQTDGGTIDRHYGSGQMMVDGWEQPALTILWITSKGGAHASSERALRRTLESLSCG
jgi:hypothetical protein